MATKNEQMFQYMDTSISPNDDFYKFATANWHNFHKKPNYASAWSPFDVLREENTKRMEKMITSPSNDHTEQKMKIFYNLYMDDKRREAYSTMPVFEYLHPFMSAPTRIDILNLLASERFNLFFKLYIDVDMMDSTRNVVYLEQDGLSLGNRDYYLSSKGNNKQIQKAFKKFFIDLMSLSIGSTSKEILNDYRTLWSIETKLAKRHKSVEDLQKPLENYHMWSVKKLSKYTNFDWENFLQLYGYDETTKLVVGQPKAIKYACKLLNELPLQTLKLFIAWQELSGATNILTEKIDDLAHEFAKVINGDVEKKPKHLRAVSLTAGYFGDVLCKKYANEYFGEDSKEYVCNIADYLSRSFENIINKQSWMSEETKKKSIEKLNAITFKIGYPDVYDDLSEIPVDNTISLYENIYNMNKFYFELNKKKKYNKPTDPNEWYMHSYTVNAYYNPANNEACFPAAILQFPFYDKELDFAFNFGGIGATIGHEMTHGFDNTGRQFDINGNLVEWWTEEDIKQFNEQNKNLIEHFNNIKINDALNANGNLTLGENLADLGGLHMAYDACMQYYEDYIKGTNKDITLNGYTWQQRFFIGYAINFADIINEELKETLTLNNEHSLAENRVNHILNQFQPWYDAFGITENSPLYIAPENRAKIW